MALVSRSLVLGSCASALFAVGCGTSGSPTGDAGSPPQVDAGPSPDADIPRGGTVLLDEPFEDSNFAGRGWYDGSAGTINPAEHAPGGSTGSFECAFIGGASSCTAGKPARHAIAPTETLYLGFWIKFGPGWVGSGRPYHPHIFYFVTDLDGPYVGPAGTHLTTYAEIVSGRALLALQDSLNVDAGCILRNDDSFVGCGGDFSTYVFTEQRSVASCNGLIGDLDGRDCFPFGAGWYSSRTWAAGTPWGTDWHHVEVYFEMNTVEGGIGIPNGRIRWWQDGQAIISSDRILFRTGAHPQARFNQFLLLPYIGDGSPIAQAFWIDDLVVRTAPP